MNLELQILKALEPKALSIRELSEALGSPNSDDFNRALHVLRNEKSWIVKHPVISGGCKGCACGVTYVWRLSISGRQHARELADVQSTG